MRFEFLVRLSGEGETPDEAWEKAVEAFTLDPGPPPEDFTEEDEEE